MTDIKIFALSKLADSFADESFASQFNALSYADRVSLLTKTDNGCNVLILAVLDKPKSVPLMLDAIMKLSSDDQVKIFKHQSQSGGNALMNAAYYQPSVFIPILNAIKKFDNKTQVDVYKQTSTLGGTVLMCAASKDSSSFAAILEAIKGLASGERIALLKQTSKVNANLLHYAINQPTSVPVMLKVMQELEFIDRIEFFRQVDEEGLNPLMYAAKRHPEALAPLIQAIFSLKELSLDEQYELINASLDKVESFYVARTKFPETIYLQCMKDMNALLARLKPSEPKDSTYTLNPGSPQMQLYQSLRTVMDEYKKSKRSSTDLAGFQRAWNTIINKARADARIQELPDVMQVLKTILLVLSIVGILYLSYQAGKNNAKNRSMFFPSTKEKTLNALQDAASILPQIDMKGLGLSKTTGSDSDFGKNPVPSAPILEDNPTVPAAPGQ